MDCSTHRFQQFGECRRIRLFTQGEVSQLPQPQPRRLPDRHPARPRFGPFLQDVRPAHHPPAYRMPAGICRASRDPSEIAARSWQNRAGSWIASSATRNVLPNCSWKLRPRVPGHGSEDPEEPIQYSRSILAHTLGLVTGTRSNPSANRKPWKTLGRRTYRRYDLREFARFLRRMVRRGALAAA